MKLQLYMFETCPYCRWVMNNIAGTGRTDVEIHDIHKNEEEYDRLVRDGGMDQVPCLFIDGKPLYESLDIIDWLNAHPQKNKLRPWFIVLEFYVQLSEQYLEKSRSECCGFCGHFA